MQGVDAGSNAEVSALGAMRHPPGSHRRGWDFGLDSCEGAANLEPPFTVGVGEAIIVVRVWLCGMQGVSIHRWNQSGSGDKLAFTCVATGMVAGPGLGCRSKWLVSRSRLEVWVGGVSGKDLDDLRRWRCRWFVEAKGVAHRWGGVGLVWGAEQNKMVYIIGARFSAACDNRLSRSETSTTSSKGREGRPAITASRNWKTDWL